MTWAFLVYSEELEIAGLMGYPLEKAYEDVGELQHEVEAVLGSEAHAGVPRPQGQGLCLVYAERPVENNIYCQVLPSMNKSLHNITNKLFLSS